MPERPTISVNVDWPELRRRVKQKEDTCTIEINGVTTEAMLTPTRDVLVIDTMGGLTFRIRYRDLTRNAREDPMRDLIHVKMKRIYEDAKLPAIASDQASGLDLYCYLMPGQPILELSPWVPAMIDTGIAVQIPEGYEAQVRPRSSTGVKGIHVQLGTIDQDYRGQIRLVVWSLNHATIENGERLAQLVFTPLPRVMVEVVDELTLTTRGTNGFGSTGR